jgi:glycerol-3-phosphate dehydrogenase (NAD(P)+)
MLREPQVLVLGYGEMGHAMQFLLGDRVSLDIWEKFPRGAFRSADLEESVPRADLVVFCLPAAPHREVVTRILPLLKKDAICLSIAKGLDEDGATVAQVFAALLGDRQPYALLYGPMISEEIRAGRFAFGQLGCSQPGVYARVAQPFAGTRLFIQPARDITGISWSVILKNVYAMAFGMADELRLGDNMRGYLAVAALHELDRIVQAMGGAASSPWHLAGLGDLITTATSTDSHHHELGRKLARGETDGIEGEGVHTLAMVTKHRLFDLPDYPLFDLIQGLVKDPRDAARRIECHIEAEAGRQRQEAG